MAKIKSKKRALKASAPVENPTWYGEIRGYFNSSDIAHMAAQGLSLNDYNSVKTHGPEIYGQVASGNMPPGNKWSADKINTFLNWMVNGYPKGTPAAPKVTFAAANAKATRIRKDVRSLNKTEQKNLIKAFKGVMALDTSDPNSYWVQAGYHWLPAPNTYCVHHAPAFLPWHRAYLLSFENALRSIPGCEDVTLPYWDITTPFPSFLDQVPFASYTYPENVGPGYNKGDTTSRYTTKEITANLKTYGTFDDITRAMSATDWEDFNGYFASAPNNTLIRAHDTGHVATGPTMADQNVAAFDPSFWFFHCNWDRLWWKWQQTMHATTVSGLLSTIDKKNDPTSYQTFTIPAVGALPPFSQTAADSVDSVNSLGVGYAEPFKATKKVTAMTTKTRRHSLASDNFSVDTKKVNVRVNGLNRLKIPGSFKVHLLKDGEKIASTAFFQPNEAEKCKNCVENAIVHFDFHLPMRSVSNGKLGVLVEPLNKDHVGEKFPHKLMGHPTVEVHLLLSNE